MTSVAVGVRPFRWALAGKAALPGVLLTAACLVPFLNKAYHIDDPWFLLDARQMLRTPLQPRSYEICWYGNDTCGIAAQIGGVPTALMGVALLPVVAAGGAEWLAHTEQILFAALAVVGMAALALRLGRPWKESAFAGLLLAAIPPFLPMASTAMPDVLTLMLGLWGIERLVAWREEGRITQALGAALTLGLAPFGRPHLAGLLPVGLVIVSGGLEPGSLAARARQMLVRIAPLLAAACLATGLFYATRAEGAMVQAAGTEFGPAKVAANLVSYLLYLAIPIPLGVVYVLLAAKRVVPLLALFMAGAFLGATFVWPGREPAWVLVAAAVSAAALAGLLLDTLMSADSLRIAFFLWILVPLPVIIFHHYPVKYLLMAMPAVVLILLDLSRRLAPRRAAVAGLLLVAGGTVFSAAILRADNRMAELPRTAARRLIEPYVKQGQTVWFSGQWGFYWYAQESGARVLHPEDVVLPGDLIAVGRGYIGGEGALQRHPLRELVSKEEVSCSCGRSMGAGAGLYGRGFGNLPWAWGEGSIGRFELWRVK